MAWLSNLAIALVLAVGVTPARADAQDTEVGHFDYGGQEIPVYRFGTVLADAPNMDDFAITVAYRLREFTAREGVEGCANLCRGSNGTTWGAILLTIRSHTACPRTSACPDGLESTGVDVHSHIPTQGYRPSDLDRLFLAGAYRRGDWAFTNPDLFSPADMAGGAGYMVSRRSLKFQAGVATVRLVWDMGRPPPATAAVAPRQETGWGLFLVEGQAERRWPVWLGGL